MRILCAVEWFVQKAPWTLIYASVLQATTQNWNRQPLTRTLRHQLCQMLKLPNLHKVLQPNKQQAKSKSTQQKTQGSYFFPLKISSTLPDFSNINQIFLGFGCVPPPQRKLWCFGDGVVQVSQYLPGLSAHPRASDINKHSITFLAHFLQNFKVAFM